MIYTLSTSAAALSFAGMVALLMYRKRRKRKAGLLPLPPGPPGLPFVGNAFDIPAENFWWKYKEWSDQYGSDVIYLNLFGTHVVVLNSAAACRDLLEKRSAIYSSRPSMPMMTEFIGSHWHFAFTPYNDAWKERRKVFAQAFGPSKAEQYRPALVKAVRNFLVRLLDDPKDFREHIRLLSGSFILDITYGIDVTSKDDPYITQAEKGMLAMSSAGPEAGYIVDFIPSLRWLPSWLPGVSFKRHAAAVAPHVAAMAREPFKFVEDTLRKGIARPCAATSLLQELDDVADELYQDKKKVIHDALGAAYAAGSDTTVSSVATFFLAMAENPQVQAKAQAVLDEALASQGRLPDFREYKKLPYIEAVVREVLRWRPVAPVSLPHAVTQDDVYKSYRIPAGATVIANAYVIAQDEEVYGPNTHLFDPSRFLNADQTEIRPDAPMGYETFGYGRRVCPGIQSAVESIWLTFVSILLAFNITKEGGQGQKGGGGSVKYTSGMIIHPRPFEVQIAPRSKEAEALVVNGVLTTQDFS